MEAPAKGAVVVVRFPFSDLSRTKLRPAVVLADAGRGDHVLCQVTSKPYGDSTAVVLDATAFSSGSLHMTSCARPGKLFTANRDLITEEVGALEPEALAGLVDAVMALLRTEPVGTPPIDVSEQQLLDALDRLSPQGRREAVRRLIAGASLLDRTIETLHPRIAEVAKQRGLDWAKLSDEERERLVDDILHE